MGKHDNLEFNATAKRFQKLKGYDFSKWVWKRKTKIGMIQRDKNEMYLKGKRDVTERQEEQRKEER
jgi:hypothetical protein